MERSFQIRWEGVKVGDAQEGMPPADWLRNSINNRHVRAKRSACGSAGTIVALIWAFSNPAWVEERAIVILTATRFDIPGAQTRENDTAWCLHRADVGIG